MLEPNRAALDFLLTRRSRPAKTLSQDVPSRDEIETMLMAASRTPDHGKLEPFRFLVIQGAARQRLSDHCAALMEAAGEPAAKIEKQAGSFLFGGAIIAVISAPVASEKVPEWEQNLAVGGASLALLNAALAMGWGANWLTGWASERRDFLEGALGLSPSEGVAAFIHLGRETVVPTDRPRPDIKAKTLWIEA